ncbi:MarR family winged helix-turn-helix transcriptional regulator [Pseudodesulfovibrio sediminis]|uniref:MarR family winged helix-turn-helix transcriptional regulator n=1 Tax=Pseudodesulfovibrio sediminis TaxID=2810563 RepID=UPI001E5F7C89|nr:MarR family transcriptional regulator [Pseudodesulfovibrio sediminis]
MSKRLAPHGVNPGYLEILHSLWTRDNVTQKQLHSTLDIEQATLSNTLTRMERDELLERTRNSKDRRVTQILLTHKGHSLQNVVNSAIENLQSIVNTGLTINDRRYFNRILTQMTEHIEDDLDDTTLLLIDEIQD